MTTLLTVKAASERLAKHPSSVIKLINEGELEGVHNGHKGQGRRWKVIAASLDRYIEMIQAGSR